jgi:hypothetical protein|eukprot:gene38461-47495_t
MTLKDILGMLFVACGATLGTVANKLLGLGWYVGSAVLLVFGSSLIWSAARDRKMREALDQVPGDWGDRHYVSGQHATDSSDGPED